MIYSGAELTFTPAQEKQLLHFGISHRYTTNPEPPADQDRPGCPSFSFTALLAPCLLPPPRCRWGSHSLATVSLVPRAPCPRRVPVSQSGAPLYLQALPRPTAPPQVYVFFPTSFHLPVFLFFLFNC